MNEYEFDKKIFDNNPNLKRYYDVLKQSMQEESTNSLLDAKEEGLTDEEACNYLSTRMAGFATGFITAVGYLINENSAYDLLDMVNKERNSVI
jgi:hypothetical protein